MWLETYPALVRENPAQHTSAVTERGALRNNGGGHGVVSTNPDAHQHSHAKEIPEFVPGWALQVIWQADDEYDAYDHDDHLFPINEFPAKGITKESKGQLTNNIANISSCVDSSAEEERVGGSLDGWFA